MIPSKNIDKISITGDTRDIVKRFSLLNKGILGSIKDIQFVKNTKKELAQRQIINGSIL